MARPMGAVRLRRTSPLTVITGAAILTLIFVFVFILPSSPSHAKPNRFSPALHHLSPPTSPYRKPLPGSGPLRPPPVMRYNLNNVTMTSDPIGNQEAVLILTPMARFYPEYWENLLRLSYPHALITLGFILPKTKQGHAATIALQQHVARTQQTGPEKDRFKSVIILRQDFEDTLLSQSESERHKMSNQKARRALMSKARNSLLFTTLGPATSWVLWLDSDIIETPPGLIQDLARHDKDVITPNCFQRFYNDETQKMDERPYDFNNWVDSQIARDMAANMGPDDILLEGYNEMATYRALMAYMGNNGDPHMEVALDGVGGAALLVKADVHRDGAMFPAFAFYNLIETEGFAKMAKRLGRQPVGLPNYRVSELLFCLSTRRRALVVY